MPIVAIRFAKFLLGGALAGVILGYLGRHWLDALFLFLVDFLLLLVLVPWLVVAVLTPSKKQWLTAALWGVAAFAALTCAEPVVDWAETADKNAARVYAETIKPQLEDFRSKHGQYPDQLTELEIPTAPWGFEYKRDGEEYVIDYGSLEYHSSAGTWFDDD
jgi:hypothetical protein